MAASEKSKASEKYKCGKAAGRMKSLQYTSLHCKKKKKSLNMLKRNVFTSVCFAVFVLQPDLYLITTFLTFQSTQCMRPLVNCADIFLYVGLRKQPDKTKQMCCYSFAFSIVTASTCRLLCFLVEL